jgi:tetratricopeptide (TPR) repeat protein
VRARILFVASLVLAASPTSAQVETFVQSVRELAIANAQAGPARAAGIRAASSRMSAALVEWDRRIGSMEAAIKTAGNADSYQLRIQFGLTLYARGRTADALRELDAAASLRPSSSDLQVLRALTLERLEQLENGRGVFHAAWMLDASDPVKTYYVVDHSAATRGELNDARKHLVDAYRRMRTATARPSMPPFVVLDAIPDRMTRAPVIGDDDATAEAFLLLASGRFDDAIKALRREPKSNGGVSAAAHFARGREMETQNRIAEAMSEYEAALRGTLTGRSAILVEMARLSELDGNVAEAIEIFRRAARLDPNDPMIHRELAGAYIADGRMGNALSELVAALLIDPLDAQVFAAIGQLWLDTEQYEDAADAFSRALELRPEAFEIRYALATALSRAGNEFEAARQFDMYDRQRREALERRRQDIR